MTDADPERWIGGTEFDEASTMMVCTGPSVDDVLRAYGARDVAEPIGEVSDDFWGDPWVAVHDLGGGVVLAFEDNGWQGSMAPTLRRASSAGRAASVFWNVNAVQQLAFAEAGVVLSSTTDFGYAPIATDDAAVADAVDGLDFDDWTTRRERGLVAVGRFTGRHVGIDDVRAVVAADRGHRILPWLEDHHPSGAGDDVAARRRVVESRLGAEFAELGAVPDAVLRELVWAPAEAVCRETGLAGEEAAARSSLRQRRLTPEAEILARRAWLGENVHLAGWDVLHAATNPDPLAALVSRWSRTRGVLGPAAGDMLRSASSTTDPRDGT